MRFCIISQTIVLRSIFLFFLIILDYSDRTSVNGINHWTQTKSGTIHARIDSPFFLRRPDDLVAFLRQNDYLKVVLLIQKFLITTEMELLKLMEQSNSYTIDFMYQTECIINYYLQETDLYSSLKTKKYLNRISSRKFNKYSTDTADTEMSVSGGGGGNNNGVALGTGLKIPQPICDDVSFSMSCMEHLDSMINRSNLEMLPEIPLATKEFGFQATGYVEMLINGLKNEPQSWRYPILSSYYWRSKGNAQRAIVCARRSLLLVPRKYKDIPLLSLGTIFQRSNKTRDALIALTAAVDHAPKVAENQLALANAHFLVSDFNRSMECFDQVRLIDDSYADKEKHIRKSMSCFKFIKTKLKQIESQLNVMKLCLSTFMAHKNNLNKIYESLLREQVPLGKRQMVFRPIEMKNYLTDRAQYCSIRNTPVSKEPIVLCDFHSDMYTQLKDSTSDTVVEQIRIYIDTKTEFIKNQWYLSLGVYKNLDIENFVGDIDSVITNPNAPSATTAPKGE